MFKRFTALVSMMGIFASLLVVQATAFASTATPDYLVWMDSSENVRWDVSSLLGSESVPVGGGQNEYLVIGSDEEFHGVEITMDNGASDGEYQFTYYPGGNGPFLIPDGDVEFDSLEGTVTATWDVSEMADWRAITIIDGDYATQEAAFQVLTSKYIVLLETKTPGASGETLTASDITLITEAATTATTTSTTTSSDNTSEAVTTNTTTSTEAYEMPFGDVSAGTNSAAAIAFLNYNGTINGKSEGVYAPQDTINRAELMKILVLGQGIDPSGQYPNGCLSDVAAGQWYTDPVCYAVDQGWVKGYDDGSFQPARVVNRAEAAKMIVNAMGYGDPETVAAHYITMLPDVNEGDWFAGYVATLSSAGIVDMMDSYNPGTGMTREMAAEIIFNTLVVRDGGDDMYSADARLDYLTDQGVASINDLAYTASTSSSSSSSSSINYTGSLTVHGSCDNPKLVVTNYSGVELDFSTWYVESINGDDVYPFSGITLADGESAEVYPSSGDFTDDVSNQSSIRLINPDGGFESSSSCSNS